MFGLDSPPLAGYVAPTTKLLRSTFTFTPPALPPSAERPPIGGEWFHEIKHDGYRLMVRRDARLPHISELTAWQYTGGECPGRC